MSWLTSFLNPGRGYEAGQDQLDKYYGQSQGYLNPYNQGGQHQYGNLNKYVNSFMDPQALHDKWVSGYEESGAAKNLEDLATQHGLNAASALGLMGSTPALNAIQAGTSGIVAQDRQNYLDNLMQKYLAGAQLSQGIYGAGANAAGQMGQNAMNMGDKSAAMQFGKTNAGGDMFGRLLGTGAGLGSNYLTGGFGKGGMGRGVWSTGGA